MTAFFRACREGNEENTRLLLSRGADVNVKDISGSSPLHEACEHGRASIARIILEKGADVEARDMYGWMPIDCVMGLNPHDPAREQLLDLFRQYAPEATLESVLKLSPEDPLRERTLDWYRERHPELVMEAYCAPGPRPVGV